MTSREDIAKKFPYEFGIVMSIVSSLRGTGKFDELIIMNAYETTRELASKVSRPPGLLEFWEYLQELDGDGFLLDLSDALRDNFLEAGIGRGYKTSEEEKGEKHREKIRYVIQKSRNFPV